MKSVVQKTLVLFLVVLSFHAVKAADANDAISAEITEGKVEAAAQDEVQDMIKQANGSLDRLNDLINQIGLSDSHEHLLTDLGQLEAVMMEDLKEMQSLQKNMNSMGLDQGSELFTDYGRIRSLSQDIQKLEKEAMSRAGR